MLAKRQRWSEQTLIRSILFSLHRLHSLAKSNASFVYTLHCTAADVAADVAADAAVHTAEPDCVPFQKVNQRRQKRNLSAHMRAWYVIVICRIADVLVMAVVVVGAAVQEV